MDPFWQMVGANFLWFIVTLVVCVVVAWVAKRQQRKTPPSGVAAAVPVAGLFWKYRVIAAVDEGVPLGRGETYAERLAAGLEDLHRVGWQLVAIDGNYWIFRMQSWEEAPTPPESPK